MDEYGHKRSAGGFGFSRRGSNLSFRESNHEDRSFQYCNRLGCSSRLNSMKGAELGASDKQKYPRTSFRSMSSTSIGGSSSKSFAASTDFRKSHQQRPNWASPRDTAEAIIIRHSVAEENESSSQLEEKEDPEFNCIISGVHSALPGSEDIQSPTTQMMSTVSTESSGSRSRKKISRQMGFNNQDNPSSSSSARCPALAKNTCHVTKSSSQYLGSVQPRYGLKNLSCSTIFDVFPSGCSSELGRNTKVALVMKMPSDGESSSSGSSSSAGRSSGVSSSGSLSVTNESSMPHQGPRRARNRPLSKDSPVSVQTRRASGAETRKRLHDQHGENNVSLSEPSLYPQFPRPQLTIREVVPGSPLRSFPMEQPTIFPETFGGQQSSTGWSTRNILVSSHSVDGSVPRPLRDRYGYRRFNMEGITEVLLALERIEQDDVLTYEQVLVLDANLFLGGFSFHDQHRDMRLDIDNMTYEELLALEDRMGTVSTAISEEALGECLERSSFMPAGHFTGITASGEDDAKCSICQEEYVAGDEVGKLACDHGYHVECIHQWLRQKKWCPICKKSAAPHAQVTKG